MLGPVQVAWTEVGHVPDTDLPWSYYENGTIPAALAYRKIRTRSSSAGPGDGGCGGGWLQTGASIEKIFQWLCHAGYLIPILHTGTPLCPPPKQVVKGNSKNPQVPHSVLDPSPREELSWLFLPQDYQRKETVLLFFFMET